MVRVALVMRWAYSRLTVVAVEQDEAQMVKEGLARLGKQRRRIGDTQTGRSWPHCAAVGQSLGENVRCWTLGQRQEPTIIQG